MNKKKEEREKKTKYDTFVKPKFKYIEKSLKAGATEEDTAKAIGISYASWKLYKKAYPEFSGLIVSSKQEADLPVISALYESATGTKKVIERKIVTKDGVTEEIIIEKEIPANVDAMKFWLTNRRPEEFKNKQDVKAEAEIFEKLEDFEQ